MPELYIVWTDFADFCIAIFEIQQVLYNVYSPRHKIVFMLFQKGCRSTLFKFLFSKNLSWFKSIKNNG